MAELSPATGFWSYAHIDDRAMLGHVLELADEVANIFQMISGDTIAIFVDRRSIEWGEEWRSKISTTILGTTFFIPIISPCYLRSPNCRSEFNEFWEKASKSGLGELLLPILYVDVDHDNSEDPICQIIREVQFVDWRTVKLQDKKSSDYRQLLDKMGTRLVDAARKVANTDVPPDEGEGEVSPGPGPTDTGSAGLLEALVQSQELVSAFNNAMVKTQEALKAVLSEITREPPPPNASAGQRLAYVNAISMRMREPAATFEAEAKTLENITRELTNIIMSVAEYMKDPIIAQSAKAEDLSKLRDMGDKLVQEFKKVDQARAMIVAVGRMSREMKEPISAVERGFDSFDAIKEMLLSWVSALEPVMKAEIDGTESSGS